MMVIRPSVSFYIVLTTISTTVYGNGFSWPEYPSIHHALPVQRPSTTTTYASPYEQLSLLAGNQTTSTWADIASPTDQADEYGNAAWSSLWQSFNVTPPPFSTTVSPTPVASSDLVKPTPLPFSFGNTATKNYSFPSDFEWGFTGAALQVEGAVKSEGRGPSVTELVLIPRERTVRGGGPPDVTTLNYYLYKQDIARLAAIGVKSYAFSISWSRILPFARPGSPVNKEAINHYDDLINTVLEYGMAPIVTLHHFDTPLYYRTNTSWQGMDHPEFVDGFVNYAKVVLTHYANRVGTWVSFNEPTLDASAAGNFLSSHNVVMAHAKVVHFYREELKGTGKWSLKLSFGPGFPLPLDPANPADVAAAERGVDFTIGYMTNPLYLGKQVPESVLGALGERAPRYTAEELEYVNGTADYCGFDLYAVVYFSSVEGGIEACAGNISHAAFPFCADISSTRDGWLVGPQSNSGGFTHHQHARTVFRYLSTTYPTPDGIMLAEFGWTPYRASEMSLAQARADVAGSFFYLPLLEAILESMHEDGVRFKGALGWAFVDNWEWGQYDDRYGVQAFNATTLERFYKRTIFDVVDFISEHTRKT